MSTQQALSMMVVGGDHPPFSTVKNVTRFFDGSVTNYATTNPGSAFTLTGPCTYSGTHPKWRTTSVNPAGNGSCVTAASDADHTIGTSDFLIEWWQWTVTLNLENNSVKIYQDTRLVLGTTSVPLLYSTSNNGRLQYSNGSADLITTAAAVINTTANQFISICRTGGTTYLGVDGVIVGSAADTTNYVQCQIKLGNAVNGAGGTTLFIPEYRFAIGSGTGIRTANFTPPVGPFPIE